MRLFIQCQLAVGLVLCVVILLNAFGMQNLDITKAVLGREPNSGVGFVFTLLINVAIVIAFWRSSGWLLSRFESR